MPQVPGYITWRFFGQSMNFYFMGWLLMSSRPGWDTTQIKNSAWETRHTMKFNPVTDWQMLWGLSQRVITSALLFPIHSLKYCVKGIINADARDSSSPHWHWTPMMAPTWPWIYWTWQRLQTAAGPSMQLMQWRRCYCWRLSSWMWWPVSHLVINVNPILGAI